MDPAGVLTYLLTYEIMDGGVWMTNTNGECRAALTSPSKIEKLRRRPGDFVVSVPIVSWAGGLVSTHPPWTWKAYDLWDEVLLSTRVPYLEQCQR